MKCILNMYCTDHATRDQWEMRLDWFRQYDADRYKKYWNISPEIFVQNKWMKLSTILNTYIDVPTTLWEQLVIDLFIAKYDGADLPNLDDPYIPESISVNTRLPTTETA